MLDEIVCVGDVLLRVVPTEEGYVRAFGDCDGGEGEEIAGGGEEASPRLTPGALVASMLDGASSMRRSLDLSRWRSRGRVTPPRL